MKRESLKIYVIGAIGYALLEIFFRGYTHWSMLIAGSICFYLIYNISKNFSNINIFVQGLLGAFAITTVEFIFGLIFNIILKMNVWDYSNIPFNILGQVCLTFSILWFILCLIIIPICKKITIIIEN